MRPSSMQNFGVQSGSGCYKTQTLHVMLTKVKLAMFCELKNRKLVIFG